MTKTRFIVARYRPGEAAPSLQLSYEAPTALLALAEHIKDYHVGGIYDGTTYVVRTPGRVGGQRYSTEDARLIWRGVFN